MKILHSMLAAAALLTLGCSAAYAQQGATTTIDGTQLPPPDAKFGAVIREYWQTLR